MGPAYTAEAMKDLEPNIDFVLEKNLKIMKERAGETVDIDIFCNMFVLGTAPRAVICVLNTDRCRLRRNGHVFQGERAIRSGQR